MANSNALPVFKKAPVTEVALSIEFLSLSKWDLSSALLFGAILKDDFSKIEIKPPVPSEIEKFGDEFWQHNPMQIEVLDQNNQRFWFISNPGNWLLQVQKDRFVLNWRKVSGEEEYPRYEVIRKRFSDELDRFFKFVKDNSLGETKVTQCEVTYVNDIASSDYWSSIIEATQLFTTLSNNQEAKFLRDVETLAISGSYKMGDDAGRLRFAINHALRNSDKQEVFKMNLVARGRPDNSDNDAILKWMDIGREWIVRGFEDLTTKKAHKLWEKIE